MPQTSDAFWADEHETFVTKSDPPSPWYTCFKCGHRFQFNIDGCPQCGGRAEIIDRA